MTDMIGGGSFALAPGQWTDDTSMALCLAESLLHCDGFDARDQMSRYVNWWQWGYLSSTGTCFDIGDTTVAALRRFLESGEPFAGSSEPHTAGNGSLMRLAPIPLFFHSSAEDVAEYSALSSRTTHSAPEAVECCRLLGVLIDRILGGTDKAELFSSCVPILSEPAVAELAKGSHLDKDSSSITGGGYCVESLGAALWCFAHTDAFEGAILEAVNLGDDADTTGAIVGQLAGAYYGASGIPIAWRQRLFMHDEIAHLARALHDRRAR